MWAGGVPFGYLRVRDVGQMWSNRLRRPNSDDRGSDGMDGGGQLVWEIGALSVSLAAQLGLGAIEEQLNGRTSSLAPVAVHGHPRNKEHRRLRRILPSLPRWGWDRTSRSLTSVDSQGTGIGAVVASWGLSEISRRRRFAGAEK